MYYASFGNSATFKWALEAFGFLMFKYLFFQILETLFLSFFTAISTPKTDKNSTLHTLHCTSINLRYFYVITPFTSLHFLYIHEKVMPLIVWFNVTLVTWAIE